MTASILQRDVVSPDEARLVVTERPGAGPTFLFLHGLLQAHLAWMTVWDEAGLDGCRLVAPDLRGHGASGKPDAASAYRDPARWAGDLDMVIRSLELKRPIVVAWSYGGRVLGDYLDAHGDAALGGCVFVAATTKTAPGHLAADLHGLFGDVTSDDLGVSTRALCAFAARIAPPPHDRAREEAIACAAMVPIGVRAHLMGRRADYATALSGLTVPRLVIQGGQDRVVLPAQSAWTASTCAAAYQLWEEAGHAPFLEQPKRFAEQLRSFAGH